VSILSASNTIRRTVSVSPAWRVIFFVVVLGPLVIHVTIGGRAFWCSGIAAKVLQFSLMVVFVSMPLPFLPFLPMSSVSWDSKDVKSYVTPK